MRVQAVSYSILTFQLIGSVETLFVVFLIDIPLPSDTLQLLLGDYEGIPGQKGNIIPPASPGSPPGPPPSRTYPVSLQMEATRRHPNQVPEPSQLTPFDAEEQRLCSEFAPDGQAPHPISKAEPSQPPKETHCSCLYLRSSFGLYPDLVTIVEGWKKDGPVN